MQIKTCSKNHNYVIDFIRAIAIMMVLLVYYGQTFGNPLVTQFGEMGCQMFFFASGYGCSISFNRSKSTKSFYRRRILSIVPAFWTMLTIAVNLERKYVLRGMLE